MPRIASERPVEEHMATLTRVLRQVKVAKKLGTKSKKQVVAALLDALNVLQQEAAK